MTLNFGDDIYVLYQNWKLNPNQIVMPLFGTISRNGTVIVPTFHVQMYREVSNDLFCINHSKVAWNLRLTC